ncbi:MAG: hypothetical protein AAFS10_17565, partial [Myxococcota bacterium]
YGYINGNLSAGFDSAGLIENVTVKEMLNILESERVVLDTHIKETIKKIKNLDKGSGQSNLVVQNQINTLNASIANAERMIDVSLYVAKTISYGDLNKPARPNDIVDLDSYRTRSPIAALGVDAEYSISQIRKSNRERNLELNNFMNDRLNHNRAPSIDSDRDTTNLAELARQHSGSLQEASNAQSPGNPTGDAQNQSANKPGKFKLGVAKIVAKVMKK